MYFKFYIINTLWNNIYNCDAEPKGISGCDGEIYIKCFKWGEHFNFHHVSDNKKQRKQQIEDSSSLIQHGDAFHLSSSFIFWICYWL